VPFKSQAQRRYMFAAADRGEIPLAKVREWARASRGKKLPERVKKANMDNSIFSAGCDAGMAKIARTAGKRKRKVFGVMHEGQQPPVTREQELASIPPGPEVEKQAAELLEDREDSRLRARAELMKMGPEERKRYLADMSARNHRLAMSYPETKTASEDEDKGRAPTPADKLKIRDYVRAHPGLSDKQFHDYVAGLGVNVHKAEEVVYGQARALAGGKAEEKGAKKPSPQQMAMGQKVEAEHSHDPRVRREIASDHLAEIPDYYTRLRTMERAAKTAALLKIAGKSKT